jgi:hypothetical protein
MTDNLALWNMLGRTDPSQTKKFKRGGGFAGTAIKPVYTEQKMTETFGPVGIGWGFSQPQFQIVPGDNKEVMVFCWLTLWYVHDGVRSGDIPGVGGDKIITHIKASEQYNRPERWENDDEAFKKAFTDALGNAMKHLGMSADVHMGLFDDSKYIREVEAEIRHERQAEKPANDRIDSATVYVTKARDHVRCLSTAAAIEQWWVAEAGARQAHGIAKGDTHYAALSQVCADQKRLISQEKAA